jgi:integrase
MREIKAIYHVAQEQGFVSRDADPFFKFKIPKGSKRETALTIEEMRQLRDIQLDGKLESVARDVFMIIFYLGGVNMKDFLQLQPAVGGRISYLRAKTINTNDNPLPISLALQPELQPYIEKYKGTDTLFDFGYRYSNYKDFTSLVNRNLKKAAARAGIPHNLSTYVARHSWATIADELGISQNVIDYVLGHSVKGMAMQYIHRRYKAADEAMRHVIDSLG